LFLAFRINFDGLVQKTPSVWPPLAENSLPFAGLLTSLPEEHDYACEVEGQLDGLNGTLYRVGPGLYDRGADRKRMMLDGDGMVQALRFRGGQAHFRNRFVRTNKFVEEAAANRFLYPTFSCHGSGPWRNNLGLSLPNQANTTVLAWGGKLWAFALETGCLPSPGPLPVDLPGAQADRDHKFSCCGRQRCSAPLHRVAARGLHT
jgi:hypothetical protein